MFKSLIEFDLLCDYMSFYIQSILQICEKYDDAYLTLIDFVILLYMNFLPKLKYYVKL